MLAVVAPEGKKVRVEEVDGMVWVYVVEPVMSRAEAGLVLNQLVEDRITAALTPEVMAKLEARGYDEASAREFLRGYVNRELDGKGGV